MVSCVYLKNLTLFFPKTQGKIDILTQFTFSHAASKSGQNVDIASSSLFYIFYVYRIYIQN